MNRINLFILHKIDTKEDTNHLSNNMRINNKKKKNFIYEFLTMHILYDFYTLKEKMESF